VREFLSLRPTSAAVSSFRGATKSRARNPYSLTLQSISPPFLLTSSWLWIPGSAFGRPGMTAKVVLAMRFRTRALRTKTHASALDNKIEHVQLLPGTLTTKERGMGSERLGVAARTPIVAPVARRARASHAFVLSNA